MILPIKPICKKEWVRRDGTSVIFLQYCFNSEERVLVDSALAIPPEYWNNKNNRISTNLPKDYGIVKELELILSEKMRRVEDLVNYALNKSNIHPVKFLKEKFQTDFDPKQSTVVLNSTSTMDVFWHIEDYKESKRATVKHSTINVISAMELLFQKVGIQKRF